MSYIGQAIKRFEDAPLVTGSGVFLDDIALPSMLHAAVLRSDHAHARVKSVDVSAARSLPGVVGCLDLRGHLRGPGGYTFQAPGPVGGKIAEVGAAYHQLGAFSSSGAVRTTITIPIPRP